MNKRQSENEVRENVVNKLSWKMADRDENRIARQIHEGGEIDAIYGLDECGLLDGFYLFLEEAGVLGLLEKIYAEGVKRVMVPFFRFVHLYLLKTLFGVDSMHSLPSLLFSNEGAMRMVGFNAHEIENGVCKRGKKKKETEKGQDTNGPICDDALSRNIVKIPFKVIEKFFNQTVKILAKRGMFPELISVIIDPTDIRTTRKYSDCGTVTRKKRVRDKEGKWKEIEITVWGWKLIVIFYGPKKIPLAAKLLKIQESENNYTIELIKTAQKNIAPYSKIVRIKMDRGHLDGKDLWWLNEKNIEFVVPAKGNMDVTEDARALAESAIKTKDNYRVPAGCKVPAGCRVPAGCKVPAGCVQTRTQKIRRGYGKGGYTENLTTTVVGIKGLTTYDQYGPEGFDKDAAKKSFRPNKINAVVVTEWEGKDYGRHNWVVYLTNMKVHKPLKVFDEYDERSVIENSLFKEAKTGWHIKHSPQKTEQAMLIHTFFTLSIFALTNAYREWAKEQDEEELIDRDTPALGIRRWREEIKRKGKNKAVVFIEDTYGIFWLAEIMILSGIKVKDIPPQAGTREEIFSRYGLNPPSASFNQNN